LRDDHSEHANEEGRTLPRGETGELLTRGYSVMLGYWGDPDKTAEAIDEDGWMHTGDLATIDNEGYCRIVGRLGETRLRGAVCKGTGGRCRSSAPSTPKPDTRNQGLRLPAVSAADVKFEPEAPAQLLRRAARLTSAKRFRRDADLGFRYFAGLQIAHAGPSGARRPRDAASE
jgi:hypothetical protein